jgi:hypothetical protein
MQHDSFAALIEDQARYRRKAAGHYPDQAPPNLRAAASLEALAQWVRKYPDDEMVDKARVLYRQLSVPGRQKFRAHLSRFRYFDPDHTASELFAQLLRSPGRA